MTLFVSGTSLFSSGLTVRLRQLGLLLLLLSSATCAAAQSRADFEALKRKQAASPQPVPKAMPPAKVPTAAPARPARISASTSAPTPPKASIALLPSATFFSDGPQVPVGAYPSDLYTADLNGDGRPDLFTSNFDGRTVSVRLNTSGGNFATTQDLPTGRLFALVAADLDGDGDTDLLSSGMGNLKKLKRWLNNGNGHFEVGPDLPVDVNVSELRSADIDSDGDVDILAFNIYENPTATVLFNEGRGTFNVGTAVPIGKYASDDILLADFDRDGVLDLVVPDGRNGLVSIMLNDGKGHFKSQPSLSAKGLESGVLGDIDGDGDPDLLFSNRQAALVLLHLNDGQRHFKGSVAIPVSPDPTRLLVADVDSDGYLDIIVNCYNVVSIRFNNGKGRFASGTDLPIPGVHSIQLADVNGDKQPDLLLSMRGDLVRVLFGAGPARRGR